MLATQKPTQAVRMIRGLKQAGVKGMTSRDFIDMGIFKYSSRIAELRRDGWNIQASHVKGGLWQYNLIPERDFSHE